MTPAFFPAHVRNVDEAIDYLRVWCEITGGIQRDGLQVFVTSADAMHVAPFHVDYPAIGTELRLSLTTRADLKAARYSFHYRRAGGEMLWRADKHPGHEAKLGGMCHLHIGPEAHHRVASPEMTLAMIADKLLVTNLGLF